MGLCSIGCLKQLLAEDQPVCTEVSVSCSSDLPFVLKA